jgi:lactoylglutathione lyase
MFCSIKVLNLIILLLNTESKVLKTSLKMLAQNPYKFSWQQTMFRIKDPDITVPFYENNFGFKLIHKYHFNQWGFSLYFLASVPSGTVLPEPGTKESAEYLWNLDGTCLELTHNHGSEKDENFKVKNIYI